MGGAVARAKATATWNSASELHQHLSRHGVEVRLVVNGDDGDVPAMPGESDLHHSGSRRCSCSAPPAGSG
jgi:hypothetical protein